MLSRNISKLSHFVTVAKAQSLSAGARELGISQPALTLSIRKLESVLGFELFDREMGFELTGLGRELLERCEPILNQVENLERQVSLLKDGQIGEVRVGCGPVFADGMMGPAVGRFLDQRPSINLKVQVKPFAELPVLLKRRQIDLFVADYTVIEDDPDFEIEPLPSNEVVFFCRPGHPLAGRKATPEEFCSYPLLGPARPPWVEKWIRDNLGESLRGRDLQLECSHYALLKSVVMSSDSLCAASRMVIEQELRADRLALVELEAPEIRHQAGIVWLKGNRLVGAAKEMIDVLKAMSEEGAASW